MKKRKILVELFIFVTLIFLGSTIFTFWAVSSSTINTVISAKNETLDRDLAKLRSSSSLGESAVEEILAYCEENEEAISKNINQDNILLLMLDQTMIDFMDGKTKFNELSEDDKFLVSKVFYTYLSTALGAQMSEYGYSALYILNISKEKCGKVIIEAKPNDYQYCALGDSFFIDISSQDPVLKLQNGTNEESEFVSCKGNDGKNYYLGYSNVSKDHPTNYAYCIVYDMNSFLENSTKDLVTYIMTEIAILIAANLILLLYIYFYVISPVTKIEKAMKEYTATKDSSEADKKMSVIRSKNEIGVLARSFTDLTSEIDRYNSEIVTLATERERISAELNLASRIQMGAMPKNFPEKSEFELSASMKPAKEVGGDFYDFFFIDDDHLGLVIADVSGKGVPAAMFMMISKMLIKNFALMGMSPVEVLENVNKRLSEDNENKMFVTAWFGILDIKTGHVSAVNAGHEYPMIKNADGGFTLFKEKHGFVLGIMPKSKYTGYEFDIEKGGALFVYTDGAAEASDISETLFGTDRMLEALNTEPDAVPEKLIENMKTAIDTFVGDAPQFDDLTMLCVKYNGKE